MWSTTVLLHDYYFFIDGGSSHLPISLILWNDETIIAVVTIFCLHLVGAVIVVLPFDV